MVQTITPQIVTENVTVQYAPEPSQLQRSGAIISVGGTTLTTNSYQYCGNLAALTAILGSSGNYAELTNMATTFFAQFNGGGGTIGLYVLELGTQTNADGGVAALTTWLTNNPGVFYAFLCPANWDTSTKDEVGAVQITADGTGYTSAPTVTFSAPTSGTTATGTAVIQNGAVISVTITDPGNGYTAAPTVTFSGGGGTGATATATLASAINILAGNYSNNTSQLYFVVTTSSTTIANYSAYKSLWCVAPSPTAPSTEFGAAADFYNILVNNPGSANKLQNMAYRFVYGVTPWPQTGYTSQIQTILSAYGNVHLQLTQAGITQTAIFKGTVMSGIQFGSWYGIDWFEINSQLNVSAGIANGSNQQPPLLYDQPGINTLELVAQQTANDAVSFGCLQAGSVSATPFYTYTQQNPSDYQSGIYNGLSAACTAQVGFLTVQFNINVNFSPS